MFGLDIQIHATHKLMLNIQKDLQHDSKLQDRIFYLEEYGARHKVSEYLLENLGFVWDWVFVPDDLGRSMIPVFFESEEGLTLFALQYGKKYWYIPEPDYNKKWEWYNGES